MRTIQSKGPEIRGEKSNGAEIHERMERAFYVYFSFHGKLFLENNGSQLIMK